MSIQRVLIGITGASGAIYAQSLIEHLLERTDCEVIVVASAAGRGLIAEELGTETTANDGRLAKWIRADAARLANITWLPVDDISAGPASGSYRLDAMTIVPCSMRTLAAVAGGLADNLLTRAADVCLKEGRRLVMAPREMPFNAIHLENMLKLARLGVRIVPPCPPFYHKPETIDDLVQFIVQKIMEQMGLAFEGGVRWKG